MLEHTSVVKHHQFSQVHWWIGCPKYTLELIGLCVYPGCLNCFCLLM